MRNPIILLTPFPSAPTINSGLTALDQKQWQGAFLGPKSGIHLDLMGIKERYSLYSTFALAAFDGTCGSAHLLFFL